MSAVSTPPLAIIGGTLPNEGKRRRNLRTVKIRGMRAGFWVYAGLAVVVASAIFPYYWSFLIGSGTAATINDPNMSWLPGGNFVENALSVVNDPAVNFWVALWNSIFSSTVIATSVVIFSTLAGWAFAKLRFRGGKWLLAFVVATMAVPMQLGVVPLYILFSDLGWTGSIGAVIVPALTSAFGVFWMTQYLSQTVPDELIEAARVDGASMLRTFWTVGVVAARPQPRCSSSSPSWERGTSSSGRSSCSIARARPSLWHCHCCSRTTSWTTRSCSRVCCSRPSRS